MAIECVNGRHTHPSNPFSVLHRTAILRRLPLRQRIDVLEEQLRMLATKQAFFEQHGILAVGERGWPNPDGGVTSERDIAGALIATFRRGCASSWWNMFSCQGLLVCLDV